MGVGIIVGVGEYCIAIVGGIIVGVGEYCRGCIL
jgi:hypothetical protein